AFRAIRWIDGIRTTITGVVLGQPGDNQIAAGLVAADAMVDRIAGHSRRQVAMPDHPGQVPTKSAPLPRHRRTPMSPFVPPRSFSPKCSGDDRSGWIRTAGSRIDTASGTTVWLYQCRSRRQIS